MEINSEIEYCEAFKTFARLHPVEAYNLNKEFFCRFVREDGYNLTDEKIKEIIETIKY